MPDPVNEVKDICDKLSPEYQHILLRYAQVAHTAENAVRKPSNSTEAVGYRESSGKPIDGLISEEITLKVKPEVLMETKTR